MRTVILPKPYNPGTWCRTPWNIAQSLRFIYRRAAREMFRFRHGPALDGPNDFTVVYPVK